MRAIQHAELGGPEVLRLVDVPRPTPSGDEVLVEIVLAGMNFSDVHGCRTGNNFLTVGEVPMIPGGEVVGSRDDSGERVLALCGLGGYAQWVTVPEDRIFPIPDDIDDIDALALFIPGMTAWHLCYSVGNIERDDAVLVHGAAGGVGSLILQLAKSQGARRVIATASSEAKRQLAIELGADAAISSEPRGMKDRILGANGGEPVDLVFELAGGDVFDQSVATLARFGRLVSYGNASGQVGAVKTRDLIIGSRSVHGMWLMDYMDQPVAQTALDRLFELARRGEVRPQIGSTYALGDAPQAQIDMAERRTLGKVILDPNK